MKSKNKKIVIIGAGLTGLSLATELVSEGFEVTVLEKKPYLGGRASNTMDRKMHDPVPIGPHVFVTAYNNMWRFFKKIKATQSISWERKIFIEIIYKGEHQQLKFSSLPKPFYVIPWLYHYKFMTQRDKLSNLRISTHVFSSSVRSLEKLDNINAYDYLLKYHVSKGAIDKFWRFFVLSMLNVPLEFCSAAEFAILLKHWSQLKHKKFGFAKVGLGDIYTKRAKEYILKNGGRILEADVKRIRIAKGKVKDLLVKQNGKSKSVSADLYASTLNPVELRRLLPESLLFTDFFRVLNAFEGVPYIAVNLWFDRKISDKKFWALLNDEETPLYMNTDFYDQSNIYSTRKNHSFITSNIIYSKPYAAMTDSEIVKKTLEELREVFPKMTAKLTHFHVHRIPYVIYAPYPGMRQHKLPHKTPIQNFYVTGDWTVKETQCMESAVRSGYKCAEVILNDIGVTKKICDDNIQ